MARALAAQGFVVLRFDLSGIGDSRSSYDDISFDERTISELDEAMRYLGTEYQSDKFILTGICSGAKIAYEAQCSDARVGGAAPINIYRLYSAPTHGLCQWLWRHKYQLLYFLPGRFARRHTYIDSPKKVSGNFSVINMMGLRPENTR